MSKLSVPVNNEDPPQYHVEPISSLQNESHPFVEQKSSLLYLKDWKKPTSIEVNFFTNGVFLSFSMAQGIVMLITLTLFLGATFYFVIGCIGLENGIEGQGFNCPAMGTLLYFGVSIFLLVLASLVGVLIGVFGMFKKYWPVLGFSILYILLTAISLSISVPLSLLFLVCSLCFFVTIIYALYGVPFFVAGSFVLGTALFCTLPCVCFGCANALFPLFKFYVLVTEKPQQKLIQIDNTNVYHENPQHQQWRRMEEEEYHDMEPSGNLQKVGESDFKNDNPEMESVY